ncbi:MAG: sugar ABC transporter ATP-binding protein [Lentisphaeria bacterium]|nr:sugar ABC transporter ATP-binding protein [Lentisphaeria bacterium]
MLRVENLTKCYDAEKALDGVSLTLEAGRILGLIGENGAGKSTFTKCLTGVVKPTFGRIELEPGVSVGWIPQEFNLVEHLTVTENIFLGRERSRFGLLDRAAMRREAARRLARLHADIDPDTPVAELPPSGKQMVEFAKALDESYRLLLMDEPTTILNAEETRRLFAIMREFKASGGSIIYISHKLAEVKEICDEIAVLRDGTLVSVSPASELDPPEMARRMVGRELSRMFPDSPSNPPGTPALEVEHLSSGRAVRDVSFVLRHGEILGVAGLAGAGRTEMAEALMALRRIDGGTVKVNGRAVRFRRPAEAVAAGLSYLPEDRQGSGILPGFTIGENITLVSLARYCRGLLRPAEIRRAAEAYVKEFRIKPARPDALLCELSGGNQQKVAMAKGLDTRPEIFIFDEPTRGVDIAARRDIYEFIRNLANGGVACLLISSDMEEILGMCGRVMVMRAGAVAGFRSGEELTQEELMYLAIGVERR